MKNRSFQPFTNRSAIILSLCIGGILNSIMFLGYIYIKDQEPGATSRLIYTFLTNIVVLYVLYKFCFKAVQQKVKKAGRFGITILGSVVIAVLLSLAISKCYELFFQSNPVLINLYYITNLIKDLIITIIVLLSTFLLYTVGERQHTLLENERLIADNIRIRYEVLKNQVDPHFLFNSLNTLDGLIGMDTDKAHEYVQHLSQVFRYAIGNKEIMYLNEELNFTESYAHLMKIRYGDNFQIQYNIDEKYKTWYIMPVSLQLLVENAVKHNVISTKHPLVLTIETTANDTIRVQNVIQPKKEPEQGEGIGLANLRERYELLFQKEVMITITDLFTVEIPLIKELEDTKINNRNESSNNRRRACCGPEFATIG
jgi:sensor histidine kinase YesM